ncbi:MAG: DNA repair protein RecN [Gammaproteobacteria bacterium]|nr:MAG: DNA repair protein RecN [Gammaproteobacteria bacterium]
MLISLSIRDLAVVTQLNLELSAGLTVLTGETGAGKSILLTAIGLALGDRADPGYLRAGAEKAEIELVFDTSDAPSAQAWLEEQSLDEQKACIIRRQINQDGRSKAWINGRASTLKSLQTLSEQLIEIHGQHAHLSLLNNAEQLRLLDNAANNETERRRVATLADQWKKAHVTLKELKQNSQDQQAKEALLRYQLQELEELNIETLDFANLEQEHRTLANVDKILITGQQQLDQLYENDQLSANALLGRSIDALEELEQLAPRLGDPKQLLNEAQIQLQEAVSLIRQRIDQMEPDPQRLAWLDEQIGLLSDLARKHQTTPEALPEKMAALQTELKSIERSSEENSELNQLLEILKSDYDSASEVLSKLRTQAAITLQNKISTSIKQLGMPQGQFLIEVKADQSKQPQIEGKDSVEFLVSANPGLPPGPLNKVASGGELSRISLAIQVAASDTKSTPTLIFDEVDSGIGGGIAEIVGQKLKALAGNNQILCVTHLPQVASQGNHHLLIEKTSSKNETQTTVKQLTREDRLNEIARMLGGLKITDQTLAHAREMLATST